MRSEIRKEWFQNPDWWFNTTPEIDSYLTEKYEYLLDLNLESEDQLTCILVYDQLPRHIYRNQAASHIISFYLQKALIHASNISYKTLSDQELCFALLPFRHTQIPDLIYEALRIVWARPNITPELVRFLRATYERAPIVGLDSKEVYQLSKTVNIKPKYILSLSGGVDSMVCSLLYKEKISAAIHINYNNRKTNLSELEFLENWCAKLEIPLYSRTIHEIQREPCMCAGLRETYENYTRNIRYQCYKQFGPNAIIILGHNKDDILENIFTNIAHKTKYANLNGMTENSIVDAIQFWRPLLSKTKAEIYAIAESYDLKHLPCSTPVWSQRGQIRASVVPVLEKWHPGFTDCMHALSSTTKDLYEYLGTDIRNIILTRKYTETGYILNLDKEKLPETQIFWRCLFGELGIQVSDKSICNFLTKLYKDQKIMINKGICIRIKHENTRARWAIIFEYNKCA